MQPFQFELEGDYVELNQLLKLVGLCDSGGAGKMLVASGQVSVDGSQELRKTAKIRAGQRVSLEDIEIEVIAVPAVTLSCAPSSDAGRDRRFMEHP